MLTGNSLYSPFARHSAIKSHQVNCFNAWICFNISNITNTEIKLWADWRTYVIIDLDSQVPSHYLKQCWLLIGPLGICFIEIRNKQQGFSFKKMNLKMLSAKRQPCCLAPNVSWKNNRNRKHIQYPTQNDKATTNILGNYILTKFYSSTVVASIAKRRNTRSWINQRCYCYAWCFSRLL